MHWRKFNILGPMYLWLWWGWPMRKSMCWWIQIEPRRLPVWGIPNSFTGADNNDINCFSMSTPIFHFCLSFDIHYFKENCIGGCPCSSFDCISTTTAPPSTTTSPSLSTQKAVLVLNTESNKNSPMVIEFNGTIISISYPPIPYKSLRYCSWRYWFWIWRRNEYCSRMWHYF